MALNFSASVGRAVIACAALASPATAAGLLPAPADPVVAPARIAPAAIDWTGPYAGVNLGLNAGRTDAELRDFFGPLIVNDVENLGLFPREIDETDSGLAGGLVLGYAIQRDAFVGGVELDFSALGHDTTAELSVFDPSPGFTTDTDTTYGTEVSSLATLRLRAGVARGRNLFFGTAGLAAGRVTNSFTLALPEPDILPPYFNEFSEEDTLTGYAVGLGYERLVTDRVSVRTELIYYDLEDVTIAARDVETFGDQGLDYEFSNDGYLARLGVNFRF